MRSRNQILLHCTNCKKKTHRVYKGEEGFGPCSKCGGKLVRVSPNKLIVSKYS